MTNIKNKPYWRFFSLLSITLIAIIGALWSSGCDYCDPPAVQSKNYPGSYFSNIPFRNHITANKVQVKPGESVEHFLGGSKVPGKVLPEHIRLKWTPPPGASNFSFEGRQPDSSGPPFFFSNFDPNGQAIDVTFEMPELPEGQEQDKVQETLESYHSDGTYHATVLETTISKNAPSIANETIASNTTITPQNPNFSPPWFINSSLTISNTTLTTQLCQDWLDFLKSDQAFLAMRSPVSNTVQLQSYEIPLIYDTHKQPTVALLDLSGGIPTEVISVPLEIRPDRINFAEDALPPVDGEHWFALGLDADQAPACPANLDLAAGEWEVQTSMRVDLGFDSDGCWECVLDAYYCFEGQENPLGTLGTLAANFYPGSVNVQTEGVTCLGPQSTNLTVYFAPRIDIQTTSAVQIMPPDTLAFPHTLVARDALTATLTYTSGLGIPWELYANDNGQPDLTTPLSDTLWIEDELDIWFVGEVISGTLAGSYALEITATAEISPVVEARSSDIIWVGEWVPPEKPALPPNDYSLFLPLLSR